MLLTTLGDSLSNIISCTYFLPDPYRVHMGLLYPAGHTAAHSVQSSAHSGREPRRTAVFTGQHTVGVFDVVSALNSYSSLVPLSRDS